MRKEKSEIKDTEVSSIGNGIEALNMLPKMEKTGSSVKWIDVIRAISCGGGADDNIIKPFREITLLEKTCKWVKLRN